MRLSFLNSNVLHQVLNKDINVVYTPTMQIFDKLLYSLDLKFFVFNRDYDSKVDNCVGLPEEYVELHSYDLLLHNDIIGFSQNNLSRTLHTNSIVLEHQYKNPKLKREDLYILNNRLKRTKKIFFNKRKMDDWNQENSFLIPYGIPLEVFYSKVDFKDRKPIVVCCNKNNIMGKQVAGYLNTNVGLSPDLIDDNFYGNLTLEEISDEFNKYQAIINLTNNELISLTATACGTNVLDMNNESSPGVINHNSMAMLVDGIKNKIAPLDTEKVHEYLTKENNFQTFKERLEQIIYITSKKEAYIL